MPQIKLYLPYGTLGLFGGGEAARRVTLHWFIVGRPEPIAPYASLVMNYKALADDARQIAEAVVDEFFSEDEFHQLRAYLREAHGEDVRTALLVAPVAAAHPDRGTRAGEARPFRLRAEDEPSPRTGVVRLSEADGYNLPFDVWGYYSLPVTDRTVLPERLRAAAAATSAAVASAAQSAAVNEKTAAAPEPSPAGSA